MKSRDGKDLDWFEIAGEDHKFEKATAIVDGETIVVHSDKVSKPLAVRFGANQLAAPNLINDAGLPGSPFLTDDWPQENNAGPVANP
jgi:sialate O-acetylesterase